MALEGFAKMCFVQLKEITKTKHTYNPRLHLQMHAHACKQKTKTIKDGYTDDMAGLMFSIHEVVL